MRRSQDAPFVVVGNTARVTVVKEGNTAITMGGAGLNFATAAALVGPEPTLITVVGDDLDSWETATVRRVSAEPFLKTSVGCSCRFQLTYDSGLEAFPGISSDYGVALLLSEHALSFNYAGARLHICCRDPLRSADLVDAALSHEPISIGLDFMLSSIQRHFGAVLPLIERVQWIFVNESEYAVIAEDLWRQPFGGAVVVTDASRGARVITFNRTVASVPGKAGTNAKDASGAGDAFAGAFAASLAMGRSLDDALAAGAEMGSRAVRGLGITGLTLQAGDIP